MGARIRSGVLWKAASGTTRGSGPKHTRKIHHQDRQYDQDVMSRVGTVDMGSQTLRSAAHIFIAGRNPAGGADGSGRRRYYVRDAGRMVSP